MHSGTVMQQHTTYIRTSTCTFTSVHLCLGSKIGLSGVSGLGKFFFVIINGHVLVHVAFHVLFIVFVTVYFITTLKTTQYTVETNNF